VAFGWVLLSLAIELRSELVGVDAVGPQSPSLDAAQRPGFRVRGGDTRCPHWQVAMGLSRPVVSAMAIWAGPMDGPLGAGSETGGPGVLEDPAGLLVLIGLCQHPDLNWFSKQLKSIHHTVSAQ
jgi:hypothetical protein